MTIELRRIAVAEVRRPLTDPIERGLSELPICATHCRARCRFQVTTGT
jgi:hypothetical protein